MKKVCFRNFHAAITMRFATLSWETQKYYARSRSSEPWRSHSTAICRDWVAKHKRITHNGCANCSSKTGSRRPSGKTTMLNEALFKRKFKSNIIRSSAPKWNKICCQSTIRNFHAATTIQFTTLNCKTHYVVFRTQPQQRVTWMQPFHCDLPRLSCKTQSEPQYATG